MAYSRLVSSNYVKKITAIDSNVDSVLIEKFIDTAQDINIQAALGTDLYNKLMDDNIAGTFNGKYATLYYDYLKKAQAHWVLYHILPFINYKLTNKSVSEKNSEHSNPTDLDNIKYLRQDVRNNAEYYSERIADYIKANINDFPEYSTNTCNEIKPKNTNYFSGFYFPDKKHNR